MTAVATASAPDAPEALAFELPPSLEAHVPIDRTGRARSDVRLLVARGRDRSVRHHRLADLPALLEAGDLLVVNTSATMPAAAPGHRPGGEAVLVHFATPALGGLWVVELRRPALGGNRPLRDASRGEEIGLDAGGVLRLVAPASPVDADGRGVRLWFAETALGDEVETWLARNGRPVRYVDPSELVGLDDYQTVFADPSSGAGSAEMPSAGRPFTAELVSALVTAGVVVAPLELHAGVSSLEDGERPPPERYRVPEATAALVDHVHERAGRVIALGTTVVRALESAADSQGRAHPSHGWAEVVLGPERPALVVDGLVTGWHEPRSSHLRLLEAVTDRDLLERSYTAALAARYRWHEFGDLHLILP